VKLSELFCALLCTTVVHSDMHTHIRAVLKVEYLWSPYVIGQTIIFLPCSFFLSFSIFFFFFARLISAAIGWMSTVV